MKKIIPFKKEVLFKTNINEILSIALDKEFKVSNNEIRGTFKVYGEYNDFDSVKPFEFEIPYSSYLDDNLSLANAKLDIDDFYYEISQDKKLIINIDISLDNVEPIPLIEFDEPLIERNEEPLIERNTIPTVESEENIEEIFEYDTSKNDSYITYRVYIVRENDTIDSICEKYQITKEQLAKYNILNNINIGDKLIIPNENNK